MKMTLSVVMISKNSESLLRYSLLSIVDFADEIVLLDSNSKDNTVEIARSAGAKVFITYDWKGYGIQRQRAQRFATCDYILMIDTDEQVTPQLRQSIQTVLLYPSESKVVYSFSRKNYFLGRFMKYSNWYPDYVIRLYKRKHYEYDNNQVHESLSCKDATIVQLNGDLLHFTCQSFSHFQSKQLNYATIWAKEYYQRGKKVFLINVFIYAIVSFFKTLFLHGSFLDGKQGWLLAVINSQYTFNKYAELWFLNLNYSENNKS